MKLSKADFWSYIFLTAVIFTLTGYGWRMYHEAGFRGEAEDQVRNIADSFYDGRDFVLFGKYRIVRNQGYIYKVSECK